MIDLLWFSSPCPIQIKIDFLFSAKVADYRFVSEIMQLSGTDSINRHQCNYRFRLQLVKRGPLYYISFLLYSTDWLIIHDSIYHIIALL